MRFFFFDFLYKRLCCGYSFELYRQVDAIQMGTHNICLYKEEDIKYTGCNLKTTELLDCAFIEVCAVIRSNTVRCIYFYRDDCIYSKYSDRQAWTNSADSDQTPLHSATRIGGQIDRLPSRKQINWYFMLEYCSSVCRAYEGCSKWIISIWRLQISS